MGAYKYIEELWRKKQSDVMRFLLRVRGWQFRHEKKICRLTRPSRPEKAHRVGYKAKQGYVVYRAAVRRGGRKRPNSKGIVYGKPKHHGINQLKARRNLRSIAEERVGRRFGNLRVLNSYYVNADSTYKYFEIILVDPMHGAIRKDPRIQWITGPVHKHRELRGLTSAGRAGRGLRKRGHKANKIIGSSRRSNWKIRNTLKLKRPRSLRVRGRPTAGERAGATSGREREDIRGWQWRTRWPRRREERALVGNWELSPEGKRRKHKHCTMASATPSAETQLLFAAIATAVLGVERWRFKSPAVLSKSTVFGSKKFSDRRILEQLASPRFQTALAEHGWDRLETMGPCFATIARRMLDNKLSLQEALLSLDALEPAVSDMLLHKLPVLAAAMREIAESYLARNKSVSRAKTADNKVPKVQLESDDGRVFRPVKFIARGSAGAVFTAVRVKDPELMNPQSLNSVLSQVTGTRSNTKAASGGKDGGGGLKQRFVKAVQQQLERQLALKQVEPTQKASAENEYRIASILAENDTLNSCVSYLDRLDEDDEHLWLLLRRISPSPYGIDLAEYIGHDFFKMGSRVYQELGVAIVLQLLQGIDYISGCGIVMRDVKPDNVLIDYDLDLESKIHLTARWSDFGLSVDVGKLHDASGIRSPKAVLSKHGDSFIDVSDRELCEALVGFWYDTQKLVPKPKWVHRRPPEKCYQNPERVHPSSYDLYMMGVIIASMALSVDIPHISSRGVRKAFESCLDVKLPADYLQTFELGAFMRANSDRFAPHYAVAFGTVGPALQAETLRMLSTDPRERPHHGAAANSQPGPTMPKQRQRQRRRRKGTGFQVADEDVPVVELDAPAPAPAPGANAGTGLDAPLLGEQSAPRPVPGRALQQQQQQQQQQQREQQEGRSTGLMELGDDEDEDTAEGILRPASAPLRPGFGTSGSLGSEASTRTTSSRLQQQQQQQQYYLQHELAERHSSFSLNKQFDDTRLVEEQGQIHMAELVVGMVANLNEVTDPSNHYDSSIFESFFDLTHARLQHIFQMFDDLSTNKQSGIIDYDNFRQSLQDAGLEIRDKASFERLVKKVDLDLDGGITFNEFETVVQSLKLAHMFRSAHSEREFRCINYNTKRAQEEVVGSNALKNFMYSPRPEWSSHRWIDLTMPCIFVLKCLAIKHRLHPLALEDCLKDSLKTRAKLDRYDTHLFVAFPVLTLVYDTDQSQGEDNEAGVWMPPSNGAFTRSRSRSMGRPPPASPTGKYGAADASSASILPVSTKRSEELQPLIRGKHVRKSSDIGESEAVGAHNSVQVPRVVKHNAYIFLSRPDFKTVISLVDEESQGVFQRVRRELDVSYSRLRTHDGMYLLYTMLDVLVDHYVPLVHELEGILEALSDQVRDDRFNVVTGDNEKYFSAAYHDMIKELNSLKRWMVPAQRVVSNLILEDTLDPDCVIYLRDVHDHLEQITDDINSILSGLDALKGEHDHQIEVRMNGTMNALTIVATASLPGQFLASVFGMNFANMPELHWQYGYPMFWCLTLGSWTFLYLFFRSRGYV
ncbi:60S ribosomal protein L15 [Durusdinium trenchii]|uniref:Ribosomal protein L15 n=1 Tax=Durusdinium trenchii TaxID=1381693 RepID=A0ABP0SPN1_9DINO